MGRSGKTTSGASERRSPAPGSRREARMELRSRRILDSARKVFAERGYHGATVEDIIREAGVARWTFYRHFDGKRTILVKLLDGLFTSLGLGIRRVDMTPGAPPVVDQMLDIVTRVMRTLTDNADLTRILLREAVGIDAEFDRKIDEFYSRILALIQLSLVHGQEMGIVRDCDTQLASMVVLGSVRQVLDHLLGSRRTPPPAETIGRELMQVLAQGLLVHPVEPDAGGTR